jgi:lipopolysaccharide transport system permease protein
MSDVAPVARLEDGERLTVVRQSSGWHVMDLREIWSYRELLYFMALRDVKVRYKQTAIGVAWVVLQPLAAAAIFTVVFGRLARMPSNGIPYPLFALAALLPWTYFATAFSRAAGSVVANANVVKKVYFPRVLVPLSAILSALVDLVMCLPLLFGLAWYHAQPLGTSLLFLPAFILLAVVAALGVGLLFSAVSVRYRDAMHATPFVTQVWMYATPVVYPLDLFPERWQPLLALNPLVAVVEGVRWSITGVAFPSAGVVLVSAAVSLSMLVLGAAVFRATERTIADVV